MTKMKWTMRILGLLNMFFGIVGICYYILDLSWHFQKWIAAYGIRDWAIFSLLSLCTLLLVCLLGYSGIRLIVGDKTVLRLTIVVLVLESLYFFADVTVFWLILPASIAPVAIGFWEHAWDLIAPQIVILYPLLGIIVSTVLLRAGGPVIAPKNHEE
jgi:hypothetical protein